MMEHKPSRDLIEVREYGTVGSPAVMLLHGGPGAPGYLAPVARYLADTFRVLEPLQRRSGADSLSGAGPLTVARHVADLQEVIRTRCADDPPVLVGHSWGAMLALAHAAAHPERVRALALIGCATFDTESRQRLESVRESRMDDRSRRQLERLTRELPDPDERLRVLGALFLRLDSYDLIAADHEFETCDARANVESWQDMVRLQESGVYPAAFQAIKAPVLLLHGAEDPHPGRMIRASLLPHLPQLEYREWKRCGHYPWLEKAVRDEFLVALRDWAGEQYRADGTGPRRVPQSPPGLDGPSPGC